MAALDGNGSRPPPTIRWHRVYLLLTALGLCAIALARYEVPPFDRLSGLALAALVTGSFAVVSVLHWYDRVRRRRFERDRNRPGRR